MKRRGLPRKSVTANPMVNDLANLLNQVERGLATQAQLLMQDDKQPTRLTLALLDATALFESLGIRYALIGGFAAMVYGRARFTEDVDFIAQADHEDILRAHPQVMREFRFDPDCTWKLYHQDGAEIDIWKDEHVAASLQRAKTVSLAGRPVAVVEPHDLIAMKLRADRPKDGYDITEILKHVAIDENLIRQRVTPEEYQQFCDLRRRFRL